MHWYLAIICYPGLVEPVYDTGRTKAAKVEIIDSKSDSDRMSVDESEEKLLTDLGDERASKTSDDKDNDVIDRQNEDSLDEAESLEDENGNEKESFECNKM